MCLVLEDEDPLPMKAIVIVEVLSCQIVIGLCEHLRNSITLLIQIKKSSPSNTQINSASVLEVATTFCLLDLQ